jgi:hypothetical protein
MRTDLTAREYISYFVLFQQTREQWQTVFFMTGGIFLVGALFFLVFAQTHLQPWAIPQESNMKIKVACDCRVEVACGKSWENGSVGSSGKGSGVMGGKNGKRGGAGVSGKDWENGSVGSSGKGSGLMMVGGKKGGGGGVRGGGDDHVEGLRGSRELNGNARSHIHSRASTDENTNISEDDGQGVVIVSENDSKGEGYKRGGGKSMSSHDGGGDGGNIYDGGGGEFEGEDAASGNPEEEPLTKPQVI